MLDRINAVSWQSFAQPEWNKPASVPDTLARIVSARETSALDDLHDRLLYALGNNHAGTYYPVLLAALPFMKEIIEGADPWPARIALGALDDLFASFHPEPGFEKIADASGSMLDVEAEFRRSVHGMRPLLERIAASGETNAGAAAGLVDLLNEGDAR
jgi:hypothetical protein